MKRVLVIHGPNLNLLGRREPEVYGRVSLKEIDAAIRKRAKALKLQVQIKQFNHEGDIVDALGRVQGKHDAIVMNPAAYTHTSVAIRDAVAACGVPTLEVHLSNIYGRESFRQHSLIAPVAIGQISGFGARSYLLALDAVSAGWKS